MRDNPPATPNQTRESERLLLACALQDADTARELLTLVEPFMLADPGLSRAWSALRRVLAAATGPVDLIDAVAAELGGDGGDAPSLVDLHSLPVVYSLANASYYGGKVLEAYARRELERIAPPELLAKGDDLTTAALAAGIEARARRLVEMEAGAKRRLLPEPLTGDGWNAEPPPREWLIDGWLPAGELALLAGPGNAGKGLLSVQLAAALACDRRILQNAGGWLPAGAAVQAEAPALCADPCPVVLAGWEDDRAELLRRRHRLSMYGGCEWARDPSINARLHALPMTGTVWEATRGEVLTDGALTPTGAALLEYSAQIGARLLVIDPTGMALALPEIDRAAVSLALGELRRWAQRTGTTVLLVGHPAKATAGEGADYSGSTAWLGTVRTLWTLRAPTDNEADRQCEQWRRLTGGAGGFERVALLARRKNNYGPSGDAVTVATRGGGAGWYLTDTLPAKGSKQNGDPPAGKRTGPFAPDEVAQ